MTAAEAVMQLHDIARWLENNVGQGQLSADVRNCADRLHMISQPFESNNERICNQ